MTSEQYKEIGSVIGQAIIGLQKAVIELQKSLALAHKRIEQLENKLQAQAEAEL